MEIIAPHVFNAIDIINRNIDDICCLLCGKFGNESVKDNDRNKEQNYTCASQKGCTYKKMFHGVCVLRNLKASNKLNDAHT
jgi:hypothetical protein